MNPLQDLMDWISEILNDAIISIWKAFFTYAGVALTVDPLDERIFRVHFAVRSLTFVAFVLIVAIGGIIVMTHESLQTQYSVREILPRLIISVVIVYLIYQLISKSVDFNNDIVAALLSVRDELDHSRWISRPADLVDGIAMILSYPIRGIYGTTLTTMILLVLMLIASVVLLVSAIFRGIVAAGLMMIAPACLAGHALPQTDSVARWWWRMWAACHMSSIGQAAVLNLWSRIAFTAEGVPNPGPTSTEDLDLNIVYLLVAIWAMWKVHALSFQWARGRPVRFPGSRLAMAVGGMMAWRGINSWGRKQKPKFDSKPASTTGRRSSQVAPSYRKVGASRQLQLPAGPNAKRTPGLNPPADPATSPPDWNATPTKPKKQGNGKPVRRRSPVVVPANAPKGRTTTPPSAAKAPKKPPPRTGTPRRPGVVPPVLPQRPSPPPSSPRKKGGAR